MQDEQHAVAEVSSRTQQLAEATSAEYSRDELQRLGHSMVQIHRAFDQDFEVQKPSPGQMSFHALRAFAKETGQEGPAIFSDLKVARANLMNKLETDAMCSLRFALFAQRLHLQDHQFLREQGDLLGQFSICHQRKALTYGEERYTRRKNKKQKNKNKTKKPMATHFADG